METTTVHMLPVCECGHVIPDLQMKINIEKLEINCKRSLIEFLPACCPNCGRHIESLQIDSRYVDMFTQGRGGK